MSYIPLEQCKHGWGYVLASRNLDYGVFNQVDKGFVGIRSKFGDQYLFTEDHWDLGAPHGTARPLVLDEQCPVDVKENKELFDWIEQRIKACSAKGLFENLSDEEV